jgi:hypothetical protein
MRGAGGSGDRSQGGATKRKSARGGAAVGSPESASRRCGGGVGESKSCPSVLVYVSTSLPRCNHQIGQLDFFTELKD